VASVRPHNDTVRVFSLRLVLTGAAACALGVLAVPRVFRAATPISHSLPERADLTLVHLADLHLSSRGGPRDTPWTHKIVIGGYKLHQPCTGRAIELLERAVDVIHRQIKPDAVLVSGDVIDSGNDLEALKTASRILRRLRCPVIVARGYHDAAWRAGARRVWEPEFGPADGMIEVDGVDLFHLPFAPGADALARLRQGAGGRGARAAPRVLCLHRMLYPSRLMDRLSKQYCRSLVDPRRDRIIEIIAGTPGAWLVLTGHSHTNHEYAGGNTIELCTASLAEYPHELRIIKMSGGQVHTRIMMLD